jgi:Domain of unknown function (DUF4331)
LFLGVRRDPFFADAEGAFHGFRWTGKDAFADKNIQCIAVEVPDDMLGADPVIGVWATVSVRRDGTLIQVDRGGHPTINPEDAKDLFNTRHPADDVANYFESWSSMLRQNGHANEEATVAALTVLPDILRYDRSRPASYPNGRHPRDDAFMARMNFLSHGQAGDSGIKPHADLPADFPTSSRRSPGVRQPRPRRGRARDETGRRRCHRHRHQRVATMVPARSPRR